MIVSICSSRKSFLAILLLTLALAVAGCGGDEEDESSSRATPDSTPTADTTQTEPEPEAETETTDPDPETETLPDDGDGTGSPESGTGGAGDEEPAQTLALFTGENGAITPRVVRVPAFISVRVELRSGDGAEYTLTFGDRRIEVTDGLSSVSTTFEGLRPGAKLLGTATGASQNVRIEATAEPGP
ncbi:MAG: hypothetical protein H0T69_01450 [Thermoleophilaceae bacterium]|nr:hypothetical protein [Thermoleophilaceae bacterium]